MRKRLIMPEILVALLLPALVMLLSACGAQESQLPPPAEMFAAIQAEVELPEMIDTTETDLEPLIGIEMDDCQSAVCYRLKDGIAPDEIIIVQAKDNDAAKKILTLLENRLEYKRKSAQLYLTENQPMLQAGTVRQDGLTVSLIVSEKSEEVVRVFEALSKNYTFS